MTETPNPGAGSSEATDQPPRLEITASRQCTTWLADMGASLAVTSYQTGKVFLFGLGVDDKLSIAERTIERCMGLIADGDELYLASAYQIWRFRNVLENGATHDGYDALYVPRQAYITGDVDAHDMQIGPDGRLIFANTLFSCLATVSQDYSFEAVWVPPFISRLAAEDRCHLNGVALDETGAPKYVTITSRTDSAEAWRDNRVNGGQVLELPSGEAIVSQLCMPHSPRWYKNKLWLCEAGTGQFGFCDLDKGAFEPIAFCPGFLRGCTFVGDYAVITTSLPRGSKTFQGLPLDEALSKRNVQPRCALNVIDLKSGDRVHWIEFDGVVTELFEAAALPGVRRPHMIGFKSNEIRRTISLPPMTPKQSGW